MPGRFVRGVHPTAILAALALAAASPVRGDDADAAAKAHGRLDGMRFVGAFAPESAPADVKQDILFFGDGHFWSDNCVPCGFAPGVYWLRLDGDAIHFRGVMESPERGRFTYVGVIRAGHLSATINWRRERWYWSIDRNFRFEGTLSAKAVTERAARVARIAAAEGELPKPPEVCPL